MSTADFVPTARENRGKGPRTKRKLKALKRRQAIEARLEYAQPEEPRKRRREDD